MLGLYQPITSREAPNLIVRIEKALGYGSVDWPTATSITISQPHFLSSVPSILLQRTEKRFVAHVFEIEGREKSVGARAASRLFRNN